MVRRLLLAAFAGALVASLWMLLVMSVFALVTKGPCNTDNFECLGQAIFGGLASIPVALVAAWPILWALRVRPAGRVALLAPFIFAGLGWLAYVTVAKYQTALVLVLTAAISYAFAAWLTGRKGVPTRGSTPEHQSDGSS